MCGRYRQLCHHMSGELRTAKKIRIGGSNEEGLVVPVLPGRVQRVAGVKLDFLIDDLRPLKLIPVGAWTAIPTNVRPLSCRFRKASSIGLNRA